MHARHIGLCAEVFQVQPGAGVGVLAQHRLVTVRQLAAKGLDDHIGNVAGGNQGPGQNLHLRMAPRGHPVQRSGIVHPKPDPCTLLSQRARQAPAHPQVAMVVNDTAKNIPAQRQRMGCRS